MKREILFRGKRKDGRGWVYGYLIQTNEWCYISSNTSRKKLEPIFTLEPIIPETISQFTGLTDKNGVKIFEGDVYKDEQEDLFKVIQMDCGRYALELIEDGYIDEFVDWSYVEVIGNIHDA